MEVKQDTKVLVCDQLNIEVFFIWYNSVSMCSSKCWTIGKPPFPFLYLCYSYRLMYAGINR